MKLAALTIGIALSVLAPVCASAADQASAGAPQNICIDPSLGYNASPIGHREIWIRKEVGENRPALKLTTTCFNLEPSDAITVRSLTHCVDRGDRVIALGIDGKAQRCRITSVEPYTPPEKHEDGNNG